jgi:hypothetical protein
VGGAAPPTKTGAIAVDNTRAPGKMTYGALRTGKPAPAPPTTQPGASLGAPTTITPAAKIQTPALITPPAPVNEGVARLLSLLGPAAAVLGN